MTFRFPANDRALGVREDTVELAALSWLDLAGWRVVPGDYLAPDGPMGARASYREALLEPELRSALATLNPEATAAMLDDGVRAIKAQPSQDLLENNHAAWRLLEQGVPVEVTEDGETRTRPLRLLDRENPRANRLLAANQFIVQGEGGTVRADVVLFVNGLPLAVLELKSPTDEAATLERAHTQLRNYKAKTPDLFRFNAALVISDGTEARIGSLTAGLDRFGPWRTIDDEAEPDGSRPELEVLIRGALSPANLLALAVDFTAFEVRDGAVRAKKLAGYHQVAAVGRALRSTLAAAGEGGEGRGGVIWHTQGSGKSLTMLFFVRALQLARPLKNPTIVLVTDRNDLDQQLFETFQAHPETLRGVPRRAEGVAELRPLLAVDIGGLVFTTMQKFRGEEGEHPLLTARRNVVVIADEAHRTQYGFGKRFVRGDRGVREAAGFAEYLRQALPNATSVGFTGTPISLEGGRDTEAVFGPVIDAYDMSRAVADKATVPIHYSARLSRLHLNLTEAERDQLDDLAEVWTEGEEVVQGEKRKGELTRYEAVVGAPERVRQVAADLVEHFERRREALGGGKGMAVAMNRRIAVALHDEIARLRPDWISPSDAQGLLKVVMTGAGNSDPPEFQPHLRTKKALERLAERFKAPDSGFDLVIVRDMWLTGFDAPALHTLYIDKPMRGHSLMQAIARVNRVWGDKPGGLVVDYLGLGPELRAALAQYTPGDRDQVRLDVDEAVRQMLARLESAEALLDGAPWRDFFSADPAGRLTVLTRCLEHILATDRRETFVKTVSELETAFALCSGDERAVARRDEAALMSALRANLVKYTASKSGRGRAGVELELRQLLSRAVMADGVLDVFASAGLERPDLAVLSDEFLADVRRRPEKSLAVEALRRLLADEIKARGQANVVEAQKLTARLDETLRRYHNRAVDNIQVLEELIALAEDVRSARGRGDALGLNDEELAFYDALAENGSARELMQHEQLRVLAQALVQSIRGSATIDWTRKESVRAKMRIEVRKLLARYGYPPDLQKAAVDLVLTQAEALSGSWSL